MFQKIKIRKVENNVKKLNFGGKKFGIKKFETYKKFGKKYIKLEKIF